MSGAEQSGVIVIGASAGGVSALQKVVSAFPAHLDAAILVVLHIMPNVESFLPGILARAGAVPASHPEDGAYLETGKVSVAPPDRHLLLEDSRVRVFRGPRENLHRPSIDVLFRSAARAYGRRVIGVLLTGSDDDGTAGLRAIRSRGGITIVQDPVDSAYPEMPRSAIRALEPDFILPLDQIGPTLVGLVEGSIQRKERAAMANKAVEPERAEMPEGVPSAFSCPECDGTLWELRDGELLRYQCRVGHAFSELGMMDAESDRVERALWEAVRVLEESAGVCRRVAQKSGMLGNDLENRAHERERHAAVIRDLLMKDTA